MNQFSFSSEEDRNQTHCLEQEIGFQQIGDWRGNSEQKVDVDDDVEAMLSQFNMDLEDTSQIVHNFTKNHECSDIIDTLTPHIQEEEKSITDKQVQKQAEQTSPTESCPEQTLTFYEQPTQNTTLVRETILEQKWKEGGRIPLNEFSALCQTNYSPLLENYREAFKKAKQYNQSSIASLDMYCLFFRIKQNQQNKRLTVLKNLQKTAQQLSKIPLLENVYLDQRTVSAELSNQGHKRRLNSQTFCEHIQESINKIKLLLSKALQTRKDKFESIQKLLAQIDSIQHELIDLLNRSPIANNGWLESTDIKCDRYLQRKYLFERQNLYLSLLKELRQKFIVLLNTIFVKEDPVIFAVINREMIRYKSFSDSLYSPSASTAPQPTKISTMQLDTSLKDILHNIIPAQWKQWDGDAINCESMIEKANDYLQNQIFLPVVEMNQEYVQIMAPASWVPTVINNENSPIKANTNRLNANSEYPTLQALASEKHIPNKPLHMKVNVVLTIDKYLHVECGQQIASLKLKKVKLSRKGRKIIVGEKSRSIATLFGSSRALGELQFQSEEMSERFINTVLNNRNI